MIDTLGSARCPAGRGSAVRDALPGLDAGAEIGLRLASRNLDRRIVARLIEKPRPDALMVQVQPCDSLSVTLEADDVLRARCIVGATAIGSATSVLHVRPLPVARHHLRFPDEVDIVDLGRSGRPRMAVAAVLTTADCRRTAAELDGIDEAGAMVTLRGHGYASGERFVVAIDLSADSHGARLDLLGVIRRLDTDPRAGACRYGIRFDGASEAQRAVLRTLAQERHRSVNRP